MRQFLISVAGCMCAIGIVYGGIRVYQYHEASKPDLSGKAICAVLKSKHNAPSWCYEAYYD